MTRHRTVRIGIIAVSAAALVATGAGPVPALQSPDGTKTLTGVSEPVGVVIQPSDGSILVTSDGGNVSVFDPGALTPNPARTVTGVGGANGIAIRPGTGQVYLASYEHDRIYVVEQGATTPDSAKSLVAPSPASLAFDPNGDLYAASSQAERVYMFSPGATTPTRTFDAETAAAVLVHPRTRELYVGNAIADRVDVYPPGSSVPDASKALTGVSQPQGLAVHPANGRIYVSDTMAHFVRVYEPGATTARLILTLTGSTSPLGLAIHPATGDIYVADINASKVWVYPGPTMAVSSIGPVAGPVTGGTPVTITGTDLGGVTGVLFGGVPATGVVAVSPTTVTAVAPPHAVGPTDVALSGGARPVTVAGAFTYTAVAPGRATAVSGVPGNNQVTVSWAPPVDTGGVPVASYTVTPAPAGPACATTASSCTIGGLTNGTPYTFTVTTTNTASLSSVSEPSPAVTPVIPVSLKLKAKKASYRPARSGSRTLVSWAKKSTRATRVVTRSCTNGTGISSSKLCKFTVSKKSGKVKVRTKGARNVVITISIVATPRSSAGPRYGPSPTWTRTWRVK